jgi:hypothetical protein
MYYLINIIVMYLVYQSNIISHFQLLQVNSFSKYIFIIIYTKLIGVFGKELFKILLL